MARIFLVCCILTFTFVPNVLRAASALPPSFPGEWTLIGRVHAHVHGGTVTLEDGFALDHGQWTNVEVSFQARAPAGTEQVQIWAGLRCRNRDDRYVFALRGGNDNDVYLARYGPDGQARFLGFAPLDFKPEGGKWYTLRAVAFGNRFQIYLNDEKLPRLNVVDSDASWTNGGICLGGGWQPVDFYELHVKALDAEEMKALTALGDQCWAPPMVDKEALRRKHRAACQPVKVAALGSLRTNLDLDGDWLFMPDYQLPADARPVSENSDDSDWHVMPVPEFWTPGLSWLHGERGFPELSGVASTKGVAESLTVEEERRVDGYTFDWRKTKGAWYRRHLQLPTDSGGRHFVLTFDAIAKVAEVWVNGIKVGAHTGLFGRVPCDVTSALKPGDNVIAVHVTSAVDSPAAPEKVEGVAVTVEVTSKMLHSLPHGMLQDDVGGVWQPVKLTASASVYVSDCFVQPNLHGARINLEMTNSTAQSTHVGVEYSIVPYAGGAPFYEVKNEKVIDIDPATTNSLVLETPSLNPKLWSPDQPNVYNLEVQLRLEGKLIDRYTVSFGFRTFTTNGSQLMLNGKPYWLRGGNPFPNTLRPNDGALARQFIKIAREGNVAVTRSHIVPFTQTWMDAADELGMGVSFEGTWPWLMLRGDPPDPELLRVWKDEFLDLIRENRNHPSLLMWTVNNEMKFETADAGDPGLLKKKWLILDDMIKAMRATDPTRPIVADSSYVRKEAAKGYREFVKPNNIDDGDIDDGHRYYGWYNETFFHFYDGQYGRDDHTPRRPFISQEMSTGYPNSDDGHPTRFYLFKHQTPQAFVGDDAWENADPMIFLERQSFLTKELAETFRRADRDTMAGILHFAYFTWFQKPWSVEDIKLGPAYYGLQTALQPVLVSAELYGRHFYAGSEMHFRVCIVNDAKDGASLPATRLSWHIGGYDRAPMIDGSEPVPPVNYYENRWVDVTISLPSYLPMPRVGPSLELALGTDTKALSRNSYNIVIATKAWAGQGTDMPKSTNVMIIKDAATALSIPGQIEKVRNFVSDGGHVLLVHPGGALRLLYPDKIKSFAPREGEIVTMHVPESPVFDGIEPLDLAWFERGGRRVPIACTGVYHIAHDAEGVTALASHCDIHGYLQKPSDIEKYLGSPLVEIRDGKGLLLASEMCYEAGAVDPIAQRLFRNAVDYLNLPQP